jgi:hypothetical protein
MHVTKVYQSGENDINEDAYVLNRSNKIYAAIDGSTGLAGIPGYIASQTIQEALIHENQSISLFERVEAGNRNLAERSVTYYQENLGEVSTYEQIPRNQRGSTSIAAIQLERSGEYFDYIQAGDCMIFMQYDSGDIRKVTYDLVQLLDRIALNELVKFRSEEGNEMLSLKVLRKKVNPILLENRKKLNTRDGYGIIDGSEDAINHLEYGRIPMRRVKKILLLSDGLTMPINDLEQDAWLLSAQYAFAFGVSGLLEEVGKREMDDPDCVRYPRLKYQDDKTGILLEF